MGKVNEHYRQQQETAQAICQDTKLQATRQGLWGATNTLLDGL